MNHETKAFIDKLTSLDESARADWFKRIRSIVLEYDNMLVENIRFNNAHLDKMTNQITDEELQQIRSTHDETLQNFALHCSDLFSDVSKLTGSTGESISFDLVFNHFFLSERL